jgi:hypothetical protein
MVPGVGGGAEQGVEGVRSQAQLGHVGLGDHDAAGRLHARRHHAVAGRQVGGQQFASLGLGKTGCIGCILDGLRNAVQPAAARAPGQFGVALVRLHGFAA